MVDKVSSVSTIILH